MNVSFEFTENKIKDARAVLFTNCLKTRPLLALSGKWLNNTLKILYLKLLQGLRALICFTF